MNKEELKNLNVEAEKKDPGVAEDYDVRKVTSKMVKDEVKELNDNPRNNPDGD